MFNECLIHLCDCTWLNVLYILNHMLIKPKKIFEYFRLCLFWVKITSGNVFPEMRLFGWSRKFYFPEIEIRWPKKKKPLTTEIILHFYFPFKVFPKNERERETERDRERACECDRTGSRDRIEIAIAPDRDRDLAFARSHRIEIAVDAISRRSRSRLHEIAPD